MPAVMQGLNQLGLLLIACTKVTLNRDHAARSGDAKEKTMLKKNSTFLGMAL